MKIPQWIDWNEIELTPRLRSGDPNAASAKLNPRLDTLCVLYLVWQQPLFLGEGRRNSCPLTAHSRVTVWKVHFDLWRRGFRSGQSLPPSPPALSEACLWLCDLSNDLWTLSMSVMFGLLPTGLWTAARSAAKYKHQVYLGSTKDREATQMSFLCLMPSCSCSLAIAEGLQGHPLALKCRTSLEKCTKRHV